jgi:PKD repeat protein
MRVGVILVCLSLVVIFFQPPIGFLDNTDGPTFPLEVSTDKYYYELGEEISITLSNVGNETIGFPWYPYDFYIVDSVGQVVVDTRLCWPRLTLFVKIYPGSSIPEEWGQAYDICDASNNPIPPSGNQVPQGTYRISVGFDTAWYGNQTMPIWDSVWIEIGPGNSPPVANAGPDQTVYVDDVVQFDGSASQDPDAVWQIETVDSDGDVGQFTSLALDSNDYPHISYHELFLNNSTDGNLKYARWNGSEWHIEDVTTVTIYGWETALALDANEYPHIIFGELVYTGNVDLKYARWTGSNWSIETIDTVGSTTQISMALDSNDTPHISYFDNYNRHLKYARWTGSNWSIEIVEYLKNILRPGTSIAIDSNDRPCIGYHSNKDLKYARWTGSNWVREMVDSYGDVGGWTSMALDSNDRAHFSYLNSTVFDGNGTGDLKYARWTGSNWETETIDYVGTIGFFTSIAIDEYDIPHISYHDHTNSALKYATLTGGKWTNETVDSAGYVGYWTSIAIDSNNLPHISYGAADLIFDLKYARLGDRIIPYYWYFGDGTPLGQGIETSHSYDTPGIYSVSLTVKDAHGAIFTDDCNITVLSGGQPPVADAGPDQTADEGDTVYFDGSGSYDPDGGWELTTIDSIGHVGTFNSIDLDSGDKPHVSYYDSSALDLKYAKWNGNAWINETVDSAGDVGKYSSLALDSGDYPHISYQDRLNQDLKYAKWNGSAWQIRIVDNEHQATGRYTAIAVDSNDFPHVSYIAEHKGVRILRYARWDGGVWRPETVVPGPWASGHTSIAIDSKDRPHISYYDGRSVGGLMYAKWDGTTWNVEMVEQSFPGSPLLVGTWNSIAIDRNDNPHISYMDGKNESVKYARWDGSAWGIEIACAAVRGYTSLALDRNDKPHISYAGHNRSGLKYARWNGSAWNNETVDNGYSNFISMALDQNDSPHITYWNETNGDLRYAKKGRGVLNYVWDFDAGVDSGGDGDFTNDADATGQTPANVYGDNGNYTVTLKVTDISGLWDTDTCIVTVLNVPPTADANGPYQGFEGTPIHFDGNHTDPGANDTHTYEWDFNFDGTTFTPDVTGNPSQKTWYDDYTGSIALRVTDDDGGWDLDVTTVTIVNVPPIANAGDDKEGFEVSTFTFNGSFYDPGSNDTHEFEWDFDYDGISFDVEATGQSVTYIFVDDFDGEIALRVTDDDGGVGIDTARVLVKNVPPTIPQDSWREMA